MDRFEIREINGYKYAVAGHILVDTVPAGFAEEWLDSAPEADTLLLCNADPFPGCVRAFIRRHPKGAIIAPFYTGYLLKGILKTDFNLEAVRNEKRMEDALISAVSRPGKGSFLKVTSGDEMLWTGEGFHKKIDPFMYDRPTVVIAYTSGCDHTGNMAESIAQGIRDTDGADTILLDLNGEDTDSVIARMVNASGIMIGTTTADGDAPKVVWDLLSSMSASLFGGKICGVFGSTTWDTRGVSNVTQRLRQLDLKPVDNGFTVQYAPDESAVQSIYEYGYDFGCTVQNIPNTHRSKLVKCLVCGEIFDASLGVCPVCGVGMDKCVPIEDETIGHKEDTGRTYLCVGGGIASLSAAEAIRKRDRTGKIIMVSAENTLPINRPMLTKNMAIAARVDNSINVKEAEWFSDNDIDLLLNTKVVKVDPRDKTAILDNGNTVSYDRLIWAAGAECFIPPIPGCDKDRVTAIRHLDDVKKIWQTFSKARSAVVVGGGVLGLEAAAELKKMRLSVTVLELAPQPMGRLIDQATADTLIRSAGDYGIQVYTGVNIKEITGRKSSVLYASGQTDISGNEAPDMDDGIAGGVLLADGRWFPADLVIMSCGVRATCGPVREAGCNIGRAITVNKYMETSVPDIYAAGDCAEYEGMNYQLWAEATDQGRVAGANAAGDRVPFIPVPLGANFEGMNTALYAIGDVGKSGKDYKTVEYRDDIENSFRKYWFVNNRLAGGILFGNTARIPMLSEAMEKEMSYSDLYEKL